MYEPLIRTVVNAFVFLHCHDATVCESWQARQPGISPCPISLVGTYAGFTWYEESRAAGELTLCRFVLGATANNTQNGTVRIAVAEWGSIGEVRARSGDITVRIKNPDRDPCNYSPLDGLTVQDFMLFINERPDEDGDGVYTAADLNLFMGLCGG